MSKVYVDRAVLRIDGTPFDPPCTLRSALYLCLTAPIQGDPRSGRQGDEQLSIDEKLELHRLAVLMHKRAGDGGIIELKAEDIAAIKKRAGRILFAEILGQVYAMLEDGVLPSVEESAAAHGQAILTDGSMADAKFIDGPAAAN